MFLIYLIAQITTSELMIRMIRPYQNLRSAGFCLSISPVVRNGSTSMWNTLDMSYTWFINYIFKYGIVWNEFMRFFCSLRTFWICDSYEKVFTGISLFHVKGYSTLEPSENSSLFANTAKQFENTRHCLKTMEYAMKGYNTLMSVIAFKMNQDFWRKSII